MARCALVFALALHLASCGNVISENLCVGGCGDDPDAYLTPPQIIRRHCYMSESHVVQTKDGYLLTVHRIPVNKYGQKGGQPVFIQHGLLSSSADFVITGNKSLGFILSDAGYDVWMGNARGNTFSKAHISMKNTNSSFWNFSWHQMGIFDLPAVITYINSVTNKQGELIYIGHSMGTTMFFVFSSMLPKFAQENIKVMVAMAPVAQLNEIKSPVRFFAPFVNDIGVCKSHGVLLPTLHSKWLAKYIGINQFLPNLWLIKVMAYQCEKLGGRADICENVIFAICGFDRTQFDEKKLPAILNNAPAGASTKSLVHYGQIINEGDFRCFDYGKNNIKVYGTDKPPLYNITDIKTPMYLMYGLNDWLATPDNVKHLSKVLTNKHDLYQVPYDEFNHVDFLWAKDAPQLAYKPLMKYIQLYKSENKS